ncbi:MAG: sulfatase-like hydrolase/transferase [Candidatus Rariloculaceae bacterium]
MGSRYWGALLCGFLLAGCGQDQTASTVQSEDAEATAERLNILLIMADDLGHTDLGSFGGEIRTPHLDSLDLGGVRLTNYHVAQACSQTRTMLMSGTRQPGDSIPHSR